MRRNNTTGLITVISVFTGTGSEFNHISDVPVGSHLTHFIDFDTVTPISGPTPVVHVFLSDNIGVWTNPLANADVYWTHVGNIGPGENPDIRSAGGAMTNQCVLQPIE